MIEKNNYESLKLENQLCFPLYACSRQIVNLYTPYLNELGLTYTQYITLLVLWDRKSVTIRQLCRVFFAPCEVVILISQASAILPQFAEQCVINNLEHVGIISGGKILTDDFLPRYPR